MKISLIAAIGENRELGKDNKLLWHIPEDFKRFKTTTDGHPIVMGRKTYESIGRVLPNRTNIIITRDSNYRVEGAKVVGTLERALDEAKRSAGGEEIFIIGGGQIFEQAIKIADKLYLTIVHNTFDADTYFPEYSQFKKEIYKENGESNSYKYTFLDLEK